MCAPRRRVCCRRATTSAAARHVQPHGYPRARASRAASSASQKTIAESPGSSPRPARKRFARATSCSLIASTPISSITARAGAVADPHEPRRRGIETPGARGEPEGRAEERLERILARVPPCRLGRDVREELGTDRHERGPARRHHPLVGVSYDHVEAARLERQPADRLRRIHDRQHVVIGRSRGDRVEVRDLARGHLHRAEGDDVDVSVDLSSEFGGGHESDRDSAALLHEERKEQRCELDVGRQHARAVRDREAATTPTMLDTFGPIATDSTGTPTSRAYDARASSPGIPQCSQLVRPPRQSARAASSASDAGRGGSPYDAVLRYVPAGSQSACASSIASVLTRGV